MARKKKTDSMIKAVPLPESGTNMKDTWNPAELNEETKTKDTWNPAVINEEFKRFDSWNPAELNSYLTNKYNLEAVHDADIDNDTAHFVTLEPSTIQEIDYDIDQETGTSSQAILQSATMPVPGNNSPYVYRPNPTDSTGRNFCYQTELIGGSVVWNQLVKNGNFADTSEWATTNGTRSVANNVLTFTPSAQYGNVRQDRSDILQKGHIYMYSFDYKTEANSSYVAKIGNAGYSLLSMTLPTASNFTRVNKIGEIALTTSYAINSIFIIQCISNSDFTSIDVKNVNVIDITAELGTTIANYIYNLEQNTSGSGVAWFRKYFPEVYYAYSAPTIQSTKVSGKKVVGFNQFAGNSTESNQYIGHYYIDPTNNYSKSANNSYNCFRIPVLPNTAYYICRSTHTNMSTDSIVRFISSDFSLISGSSSAYGTSGGIYNTPSNCAYIEVQLGTSASYDLNINLHWDGERDGEYEPYKSTTYDLSGSHLVKRNYEYRAYASGDESLPDTITDGTNTVTKRTTPITETVTNPTLYGIWKLDANNNLYFDGDTVEDIPNVQVIETGGTQEYVDAEVEAETRDVSIPAGGQEYYLNNITVVTVPDPPETLTSASISIDNEGIVTIMDTSGEEPETYTTSIDMPDTLMGENYLTVIPGNLTGVKYTRIQPKIRRTKK